MIGTEAVDVGVHEADAGAGHVQSQREVGRDGRFADTPFPLATAMTFLTPGRESLGVAGGSFLLLAELAELINGIDPRRVAVVPGDLVGVVADGLHCNGLGRAGRSLLR